MTRRTHAGTAEKDAHLLAHLAHLIEQTKDLDYDPSQDGSWVCGDHGIPECEQGSCANLPWPQPNDDDTLAAFTEWADEEFRRVVRPYDEGRESVMPDEAFRSYSVREWPIGDLLTRVSPPGSGDASRGEA